MGSGKDGGGVGGLVMDLRENGGGVYGNDGEVTGGCNPSLASHHHPPQPPTTLPNPPKPPSSPQHNRLSA